MNETKQYNQVFCENDKSIDTDNLDAPEELKHLIKRAYNLSEAAALCHVNLSAKSTHPLESRLGGWPAWPVNEDMPKDETGKPMVFLAQINLKEGPALPDFPTTGMLQFFIQGNNDLGRGNDPLKTGSKVVYHETLDHLVLQDPYQGISKDSFDTPFQDWSAIEFHHWNSEGLAIGLEAAYLPASAVDYRLQQEADSYYDALFENGAPDLDYEIRLNDLMEDLIGGPHKKTNFNLAGNPRFTQEDIRGMSSTKPYSRCLLAIGTIQDVIMWGDMGEACFLISPEDLIAKRFDHAIYSWDC